MIRHQFMLARRYRCCRTPPRWTPRVVIIRRMSAPKTLGARKMILGSGISSQCSKTSGRSESPIRPPSPTKLTYLFKYF